MLCICWIGGQAIVVDPERDVGHLHRCRQKQGFGIAHSRDSSSCGLRFGHANAAGTAPTSICAAAGATFRCCPWTTVRAKDRNRVEVLALRDTPEHQPAGDEKRRASSLASDVNAVYRHVGAGPWPAHI